MNIYKHYQDKLDTALKSIGDDFDTSRVVVEQPREPWFCVSRRDKIRARWPKR